VATTAGGYVAARIPGAARWLPSRTAGQAEPAEAPFVPALVTQIDIAEGSRSLPALDPVTGRTYSRAVVLVRRNQAPIGVLELTLGADGLSPAEYAREIEQALGVTVPHAPPVNAPRVHTNGNGDGRGLVRVRERPAAAVVIATRDRAESLARCLDSLRGLAHAPSEIVVVDNASAGRETAALVASLRAVDPRFRYVREDRPGLARAHNCGLEHVSAPLIAFTDDDVVVDSAWLGGLVDGFGRHLNVACVTGMIFPLELETSAQDWLEQYAGFNKGFESRLFDLTRPSADPLFPYTAGALGSGANMAFRTDVLRSMRGFDPALGAGTEAKGGDDLAAFFDVIAAGHALAYEPGAIVYHQHHRTFEALHRQTFGYGAGLTAYLTKTIVDEPRRGLDMLARAPRAAHHAFSPRSAKNERLPVTTPPTLVRRERLGMLAGPALYLLSRWDTRLDPRPGEMTAEPIPDGPGTDEPSTTVPDIDLVDLDLREASGAP
jgi:GT2 family glycosyltransferase